MRLNIRAKLILYTTSLICALMLAIGWYIADQEKSTLYENARERTMALSQMLARDLAPMLKQKHHTEGIRLLTALQETHPLVGGILTHLDGEVIWSLPSNGLQPHRPQGHWTSTLNEADITIAGPIIHDATPIGSLSLTFSNASIHHQLERLYLHLVIALVVCILIGSGVAILFSGRLVKPLRLLTERAKGIRAGQEIPLEDIIRQDEIGAISRGFATLVKDLRSSNQELQRFAESLEKKVKDRTTELEKATQEAQQAAQSKAEFLATMSHEIRTPLNGIIGFSTLLLEAGLTEKQRADVQIIHTSATSLLSIINDILDFSKLEAGKFEVEAIPFDLSEVIHHTYVLFKHTFEEKNVAFKIPDLKSIPTHLIGDPARLRQVLLNLLSNALKFTNKGHVHLEIIEVRETDTSTTLEFSVQDTGIGMPPHIQDKLFSEFTQADSSTSRKYGGTGLGLAISKKICRLMKGDIYVSSEEGKGTRFWFTLPFEKQAAPSKTDTTGGKTEAIDAKTPKRTTPLKILVAEDNKVNQMLMKAILTKAGYAFDLAENGKIAVEMATAKEYDLLLMDIQMPEMDGLEATQRIRQLSEHYESVPIAALTAHAMSGDKEKFLASGMDHVLLKPLDVDQLYALIQKYE